MTVATSPFVNNLFEIIRNIVNFTIMFLILFFSHFSSNCFEILLVKLIRPAALQLAELKLILTAFKFEGVINFSDLAILMPLADF